MTLTPFLLAAAISIVGVPLVRLVALRIRLVDIPNDRSSHQSVTPRGAGIVVVAAAITALATSLDGWSQATTGVVLGAFLLACLGLSDDIHSMTAQAKLIAQTVLVAIAVPFLLQSFTGPSWWLFGFGIGAACWCLAYVNAFNFMDGINGMSVAQATIAGLGIAVVGHRWDFPLLTVAGLAVAGAALGFAPFNVPVAKIFLGDVGAYFIGFWLAALLILELRVGVPTEVAIAPFLLYLTDTGATIVRRRRKGEELRLGHRQHAYQQLTDAGWSQISVSALAALVMAGGTGLMITLDHSSALVRSAGFIVSLIPVIGFVLLPSVLSRRAQVNPT